uniref:Ig-like domain-containing protein n=2 Tax=Astyanax mexicanus TaxID=7994 RepID=A0A8B9KHS0_ASTMX
MSALLSSVRMEVCLFLLLTVFHVTEGCSLENYQGRRDITARSGESVLLPCFCTYLPFTPETITWKKYTNTWTIISSESDQYRNRVQLFNHLSPANLSLLISHLTEEDAGFYRCEVKNSGYTDISLTVEGCRLNYQQLIQITAHTGESVLLPCSCTDLQTTPDTFTWKKDNTISNRFEEISSESDQYRNRVQLFNNLSPANLSLLISHLTEEDAGWYRCEHKQEYMDIRLTVTVAPTTPERSNPVAEDRTSTAMFDSNDEDGSHSPTSNTDYFIFAAVGGLLLLMILVGVFYWRYRAQRRGQSCEGEAGQKRDQDCSDGLYCTVSSEPTDTSEQKQDDVTYSSVVHFKTSTPTPTALNTEDNTEYASIKLN